MFPSRGTKQGFYGQPNLSRSGCVSKGFVFRNMAVSPFSLCSSSHTPPSLSSPDSSSSLQLSIGLEEEVHLPLEGGVPEVGVSSVPLHVPDLDLGDALAPLLLLQADPQGRDLVLEDVVAALQPADGKALIWGYFWTGRPPCWDSPEDLGLVLGPLVGHLLLQLGQEGLSVAGLRLRLRPLQVRRSRGEEDV